MSRSYSSVVLTSTEYLQSYKVVQLKSLAYLLTTHPPTRKADLIALVVNHLSDDANLKRIWQSLNDLQQKAVAEVIYGVDDTFNAGNFKAKYGKNPQWGKLPRYSSGYGSKKGNPSPLHLLFYNNTLPPDLKTRLKPFVPAPSAVSITTLDNPPESVVSNKEPTPIIRRPTELEAQLELMTVLRLIDAGKLRASAKTKRPSAASVRTLASMLVNGDFYGDDITMDSWSHTPVNPIKAFAWHMLIQSAGFARLNGTKLELTRAGKKALITPPENSIKIAWNKWLKNRLLDEFNRINIVKGQTGKGKRGMTMVSERRQTIVDALANIPPNKWVSFREFSRFIRANHHIFKVSRNLWYLYVEHSEYGSLGYEGYGSWEVVEERYMLAFLFEYAGTLGIIDLAYIPPSGAKNDYTHLWGIDGLECFSRYDGLLYFRVNNLGSYCFDNDVNYTPPKTETKNILKILPNMDIVATAPLTSADGLFLDRIATKTSDNVWHLDQVSIITFLEDGQKIETIANFLTANSSNDLPQPVTVFLTEIGQRVTKLNHAGEAMLIQVADPALAQLIANDSRLKRYCMVSTSAKGESFLVVPASSTTTFRRHLRKFGYGLTIKL